MTQETLKTTGINSNGQLKSSAPNSGYAVIRINSQDMNSYKETIEKIFLSNVNAEKYKKEQSYLFKNIVYYIRKYELQT